ncbi:MAG: Gfo/Idh/MocA family oxidoreductase [Octadecabacter sp.]|nr:Gfo/Idh/MocA family oxidoreductase [Octadecabacter sp.]
MDVALVGVGKIALDQHVPAIMASMDWSLSATVSRTGKVNGVRTYRDFAQMLTDRPDIRVVSLCMPPVPRFTYAAAALDAGRHVMLEKPPGATLSECHMLAAMAKERGLTLFATWHSREAAMVQAAKTWLASQTLRDLEVVWKEDVRRWHPDQDWIWEPGGMGVFDPGINALSILTEILPVTIHLRAATLEVPEGRQAPIAATLDFIHPQGADVSAVFDWRQEGTQNWSIEATSTTGRMRLSDGGAKLEINGAVVTSNDKDLNGIMGEYPRLYHKMAALIADGISDVDLAPLRHVADAFMMGRRIIVAPFIT